MTTIATAPARFRSAARSASDPVSTPSRNSVGPHASRARTTRIRGDSSTEGGLHHRRPVMKSASALSAVLTVIGLSGAATLSAQQTSADPASAGAAAPAPAASETESSADLAKKLSNPIADLVSLPFQFNWENGICPLDLTRYILHIQPVMPFSLNKNTNMIVRVIAPIV